MSIRPAVGEVWFAELGLVAKNRPVLVLASPCDEDARVLVVIAPLTSQLRSMTGEVHLGPLSWLPKLSAVNVQGITSVNLNTLIRRMGTLTPGQMTAVKQALRNLLDL